MSDTSREKHIQNLVKAAIDGMESKKALEITKLDLRKIDNSVCDYFIICHANSNTQVRAIADSIEEVVLETTGDKVWHKEGLDNLEWVLLDYVNVVVHVFQKPFRAHYEIEKLWGDAVVEQIESIY